MARGSGETEMVRKREVKGVFEVGKWKRELAEGCFKSGEKGVKEEQLKGSVVQEGFKSGGKGGVGV